MTAEYKSKEEIQNILETNKGWDSFCFSL